MSSLHPGLFVAEGTSDAPLADLVEVLFLRCGVQVNLSRPDFALLKVARDVASRIDAGLALVSADVDVDVIVVHRDADNAGSAARIAEIEAAVRQVGSRASVVPVVPCRMTEAWLLLDERAIRHVARNPNGRTPLPLPKPRRPNGSPIRRRCSPSASWQRRASRAGGGTGSRAGSTRAGACYSNGSTRTAPSAA